MLSFLKGTFMKLISAILVTTFLSSFSLANTSHDDKAYHDVNKGVEKLQYDWTKLNDKDKNILKESSKMEKEAEEKVKRELEEYRLKSDELYKNLSSDSKKFLSEKSKHFKKLSNKGKKFLDDMYFLVKRGVKTFHLPAIDEVMPAVNAKTSEAATAPEKDKAVNQDAPSAESKSPDTNSTPTDVSKSPDVNLVQSDVNKTPDANSAPEKAPAEPIIDGKAASEMLNQQPSDNKATDKKQ